MTDRTGIVYIENDIELSGPIEQGMLYDKTKQNNDVIDRTVGFYVENEIDLLWLIGLGAICHENVTGQ